MTNLLPWLPLYCIIAMITVHPGLTVTFTPLLVLYIIFQEISGILTNVQTIQNLHKLLKYQFICLKQCYLQLNAEERKQKSEYWLVVWKR